MLLLLVTFTMAASRVQLNHLHLGPKTRLDRSQKGRVEPWYFRRRTVSPLSRFLLSRDLRAHSSKSTKRDWQEVQEDDSCVTDFFRLEKEDLLTKLKNEILSLVASLDRGLAASANEAERVDELAKKLELEGAAVDFISSESRERLRGNWRLIYTSGFTTGSLGGTRPGPLAAFTPLALGQVFQRIDTQHLDNVVELSSYLLQGRDGFGATLARIPGANWQNTASKDKAPSLRASLRHTYKVEEPNKVTITFESTTVKPIGAIGGFLSLNGLPQIDIPRLPDFLQPPAPLRSATFKVTFLDDVFRVTRGDRGELRIYTKDSDASPGAL